MWERVPVFPLPHFTIILFNLRSQGSHFMHSLATFYRKCGIFQKGDYLIRQSRCEKNCKKGDILPKVGELEVGTSDVVGT